MRALRWVALPVVLVLATVLGLGSYYEASDDVALSWLLSGVVSAAPVPSLPLYLHGYGRLLAAAYAALPGVPWFGGGLSALLMAATLLFFAVLHRLLRPHLPAAAAAAVLSAFFLVGWLEHWLWFSYVRVGLLLAGASLLWAAQRPGRTGPLLLGLLSLGAAWALRPGLALLSWAAVLPAVLLLAGGLRRAAPLLLSSALLLGGATLVQTLTQPPAAAHTRILDSYLASVLDYDQLRPQPRTRADSLGTQATRLWLLGDSTLTNSALYQRAYRFDAPDYLGRVLPAKFTQRLTLLARDYFPLLLVLLATWLAAGRRQSSRWFWLVQAGFGGALLIFVLLLKLPPRTALPRLDFWLLTNLVFLLQAWRAAPLPRPGLGAWLWPSAQLRRGLAGAAALAVILYAAKTVHRVHTLRAERQRHEQGLTALARRPAGTVLVLGGSNDLGKSLSPWRAYRLGPGPVLHLSGWLSHDASQGYLRRRLAGTPAQAEALRRLARRPGTGWVLAPEVAAWLRRYLAVSGGGSWPLLALAPLPGNPDLWRYEVRPAPGKP